MRARVPLDTEPTLSTGDAAVLVDAAAVAVIGAAITLAADQVGVMTGLVGAVIVARFVAWSRLPPAARDLSGWREATFFAACTLIGGGNDWNSVTRHRVYDYTVPSDVPALSLIPVWMLLYWGVILRAVTTVSRWRRLGLPPPSDTLHLGWRVLRAPAGRAGVLLGLVLFTRQCVYRFAGHPWLSWTPFAGALAVAFALLRFDRRRAALCAAVVVLGPVVEAVYIGVGHLHAYRLGWIAGVPLWIALWWGLAVLTWDELSYRACRWLVRGEPAALAAPR